MPERSELAADNPLANRPPTSHERMSGRPWDASYQDGPAPWDIGRPQPAVVRLAAAGAFAGAVLDVGCGPGENSLHLAAMGLPVLGVDVAETALAMAREKARVRGIAAEFVAADAFHLERLGRRFQTVLDFGLFHTFEEEEERMRYVSSLAAVTEPGSTMVVLCFSDAGPDTGPHPVREEVLRAAFSPANGWEIASLAPDRIYTRFHESGASAWLAIIRRI
jgi:SAM-dependent methyltransferase